MTPYEMHQLNEKRGRIKWGSERPKRREPEPSGDKMTDAQIATFFMILYTVVLMAMCAGFLCVAMLSWGL